MAKKSDGQLNLYVRRQPNNPGFMTMVKHMFTGQWDDDQPWMYNPKYAIHPDSRVGKNYLKHLRKGNVQGSHSNGQVYSGNSSIQRTASNDRHSTTPAGSWPASMSQSDGTVGAMANMPSASRHSQSIPRINVQAPSTRRLTGSTQEAAHTLSRNSRHQQRQNLDRSIRSRVTAGRTSQGGDHVRGDRSTGEFPSTKRTI
jgi:hypothetical protein